MASFKWSPEMRRVLRGSPLPGVVDGLNAAATVLQGGIKNTLNKRASIRGPGGRWAGTPSAPGQPPAKFTGTLSRSVQVQKARPVRNPRSKVTIGAAYARIHEEGGYAGRNRRVRIPKRPYVAPVIRANRKKIESIMASKIRRRNR